MKATNITALILSVMCAQAFGNTIEFDWTAFSRSSGSLTLNAPPTASFQYSGGTIANGVFTPTGLVNSSFGIPPGGFYPFFETDTAYGPSFQIDGTIEPIANEEIVPNGFPPILFFQAQTESFDYTDVHAIYTFPGVWTVTGLDVPDATNSALLLATALGALGIFHALGRRRLAQG